jgi:hypothetical protein
MKILVRGATSFDSLSDNMNVQVFFVCEKTHKYVYYICKP